jgi:hypothetical protein
VDLTTCDLRAPFVQQRDQGAHQSGLALPPLAEQDQVVPGQQRRLQLRQHGLIEADDAREGDLVGTQAGQQVGAQLLLGGPRVVPG